MDPATNRSLLSSDPFLSISSVLSGTPYYDVMPEPFLGNPEDNLAVIVDLNPGYTGFPNKHGTGCNHAIFDESEEELNIVRTALIQSLRSMSKPLTDTYMRVFKDSADLDILHIFADLGYPEAQEELEFIWSLQ